MGEVMTVVSILKMGGRGMTQYRFSAVELEEEGGYSRGFLDRVLTDERR